MATALTAPHRQSWFVGTHRRLILALAGLALMLGVALAASRPASAVDQRPNILIILTDDQRAAGTDLVMPNIEGWFHYDGVEFPEGYATTPLCCPARASILTGRYVHNHNVRKNTIADKNPDGSPLDDPNIVDQVDEWDQSHTLPAYLKRANPPYKTALFGKFLNAWPMDPTKPDHQRPLYWDRIASPLGGVGHGPPLDVYEWDGTQGTKRTGLQEYDTRYQYSQLINFIFSTEAQDDVPWMAYMGLNVPHSPLDPEDQYASASVPSFETTSNPATLQPGGASIAPSCNQGDTSGAAINLPGKPPWVVAQARRQCTSYNDPNLGFVRRVGPNHPEDHRIWQAAQLRMMKTIDDIVSDLFGDLVDFGEERNTLAFFISDNGMHWGEHWQARKGKPYTESIRIPFYMRWPDGATNVSTNRYAANIDLLPTILQAAGVTLGPTDPKLDGSSLLDQTQLRQRLVLEMAPRWASIRTSSYQYIETYKTDDPATPDVDESKEIEWQEYYDLTTDPYQLTNRYGNDGKPFNDPVTNPPASILEALLTHYRNCAGDTCPPKGDTIPPKGIDVQTENGQADAALCPAPVEKKPDDCDKVIYTFDKPIDPGSLVAGWDGSGTRTVNAIIVGNPTTSDNDHVQIEGVPLGDVDLGRNDYIGMTDRPFPASQISVSKDLKTVTVMLDGGSVAAIPRTGTGTMTWSGYSGARDVVGNLAGASPPTATEGGATDREF